MMSCRAIGTFIKCSKKGTIHDHDQREHLEPNKDMALNRFDVASEFVLHRMCKATI